MSAFGSSSKPPEVGERLGDILVRRGVISSQLLEQALRLQAEHGGRLGWILLTQGWINRLDLFKALAEHFDLPFLTIDFDEFKNEPDPELLKQVSFEEAITYHGLPVKFRDGILTLLTDYPNHRRLEAFFKDRFQALRLDRRVVTDRDFMHLVQRLYGQKIIDQSVHGLFYRDPEECAYPVLTRLQVLVFGIFIYSCLAWIYYDVISFLIFCFTLCQILFAVTVTFKVILSLAGAYYEVSEPISKAEIDALDDADLPVYTVLVPAYNEPEVIHLLIDSLKRLDYPQQKLDVLLLLEEDDEKTLEAARKARPPGNWRFIIVPDALPKTKPKACNYGVFFSRGEFLTIYDAEDIPDPNQLKMSVAAFRKHDPRYICFQAALNYFNAGENMITRMFTLEYSYWFDYLLPGLDRLQLPIPLGGTSNHFRTEYLKELGAWDPFNVTEDADLGIRACANGYKVGIINSTTFEEANSRYGNWIRQRSRWIKGYLQTALVYNRHPLAMLRRIGLKNWLAFQLFVGGTPILFLVNPMVWSVFVYWLLTQSKVLDPFFPPLLIYIGLYNLLVGNFLGIYLNMIAVFRRRLFHLLIGAILNPAYWLAFHSVAAYKALWQLFSRPFYWEKTDHGISRFHT